MLNKSLKDFYPSDWTEYRFNNLFEFEGGMSISRSKLSEEGICYLHYGDIHKSSDNYIDVEKNYDSIPKLNESIENIKEKYILNDGDIVFADASEDYEGIGKSVVVINKSNIPFVSGLHTIVARDKSNLLDNGYKRFFLSDWNIRKQIMLIATGISVYGISKENLKTIRVVLPQINEQRKIASILSTWDKAIELKEKLIEQKKVQKKGLMQKLLTGEVRLPGFNGEWKTVKLSKVVRKIKGKAVEYLDNGKFPVIDMDYLESEIFKNYTNDATVLTNKNDVILLWDGSRAGMAFTGVEGVVGSTFVKLECISINNIFLQKHLEMNEQKIQRLREGSGIPHVPKDFLNYYKIKLPPLKEQEAISNVLSKMDKDLELLTKEILCLKQQKKGLMQLLLTGKVRVQV